MVRAYWWPVLFVLAALLPPSGAAQTGVSVTQIRLMDEGGDELRVAPVDEFVTVEMTVENGGSSEIQGPLTLRLTIRSPTGRETVQELTSDEDLGAGESTTFKYSWSPTDRTLGDHRFSAQMLTPPSATALVATYEVAENGVPAGSVADRIMSFYWVLAPLVFAIILFVAVIMARRG